MTSDAQLIDMAVLRSKLLAAQTALASGTLDYAAELVEETIALLNPRLDPEANRPSVDPEAITNAIRAAHEKLIEGGLENPVEILIVQTHGADGQTTGRSLASSAANPQDLLRLCLRNVQRAQDKLG